MVLVPRRRKLLGFLLAAFGLLVFAGLFGLGGDNRGSRDNPVKHHLRSNGHQSEYIDKNGMHVVVGKYVGNTLDKDAPVFTPEELNLNGYRPVEGAGQEGQPVFLEQPSESRKAKRRWHINKFNVVVSDRININRTLPDVRKAACREKSYSITGLPDASVIIVFHNEAWSTLMRTIVSVRISLYYKYDRYECMIAKIHWSIFLQLII